MIASDVRTKPKSNIKHSDTGHFNVYTFNNQYMERGRHLHMRIMLQNGVVHALNTKVLTERMAFRRSDYLKQNCGIVHCTL